LRFSAALCVRAGLEPEVAWKALTSDGARIANVHKELGRLDAGLDADFVLWTGDPLDLTSAVVEVYVDGVRVHGGAR
jgi:imidazolonepropionase-like amidohydrolase